MQMNKPDLLQALGRDRIKVHLLQSKTPAQLLDLLVDRLKLGDLQAMSTAVAALPPGAKPKEDLRHET